jgi:hypothetical protein
MTIFSAERSDPNSLEKVRRSLAEKQKAIDAMKCMPDPSGVLSIAIESMAREIEGIRQDFRGRRAVSRILERWCLQTPPSIAL